MAIDRTPGTRNVVDRGDPIVPTIWPFRVDSVEWVPEERAEEWEKAMREKVGLSSLPAGEGAQFRPQMYKPGCATICGCSAGWDDCDYWGNGC